MRYQEVYGNLIGMAKASLFDLIAHGCNCFSTMKTGIAPKMVEAFRVDRVGLEHDMYKGDINKLGQIAWSTLVQGPPSKELTIVNCYTQYRWKTLDNPNPLDYDALRMCMRKINHRFKGSHIGLPKIGCGEAGGDWTKVKLILQEELRDCDLTVVFYDPNRLECQ